MKKTKIYASISYTLVTVVGIYLGLHGNIMGALLCCNLLSYIYVDYRQQKVIRLDNTVIMAYQAEIFELLFNKCTHEDGPEYCPRNKEHGGNI